MGTDTFADPMNILLNPVFGGIAKGIGKGVKYGGKGVKKALGKVPTKTAVAGSKAVQESAQLLSSGFRQSVESIPEHEAKEQQLKEQQAVVQTFDTSSLKMTKVAKRYEFDLKDNKVFEAIEKVHKQNLDINEYFKITLKKTAVRKLYDMKILTENELDVKEIEAFGRFK